MFELIPPVCIYMVQGGVLSSSIERSASALHLKTLSVAPPGGSIGVLHHLKSIPSMRALVCLDQWNMGLS